MELENGDSKASETPRRLGSLLQFGLIAGPFLTMIDSSVVNVALPVIASDYHSSLTSVQWILSGYLIALAAILSASAFLSKRVGAVTVYFWSIVGFTAASFLCALSPNLDTLVTVRVLQGALGAPLVPIAMDLLFGGGGGETMEGTRGRGGQRPDISPALGMILFLAPALGPTLGGYLVGYLDWQSIFLINVPIGIASAFIVRHYSTEMTRTNPDRSIRFDVVGFLLLSVGLALAIYGGSEGPLDGWLSLQAFPYLTSGIALIAVYVPWALRRQIPAVNLKLLRNTETAIALTISIVAAVVLFAVLFLLPVFMESFQGVSVVDAGLALLPQGLVTGAGTVLGDRLSKLQGVKRSVILGMTILTLSTAALLTVSVSTPVWLIATILSGRGLALGLTIQPLLIDTIGTLRGHEVSDGNTVFNVFQRLGGSLGVSLLATFLELRETHYIEPVLNELGLSKAQIAQILSGLGQSASVSSLSSLPASVMAQLGAAAADGFHDTVLVLTGVSFAGLLLALLLRRNAQTASPASEKC